MVNVFAENYGLVERIGTLKELGYLLCYQPCSLLKYETAVEIFLSVNPVLYLFPPLV